MRWLWKEDAEADAEFLEDTPVGSRSSGMSRANVDERESVGQVSGRGGWARPTLNCIFPLFLSFVP